jgi:hypothetical protein
VQAAVAASEHIPDEHVNMTGPCAALVRSVTSPDEFYAVFIATQPPHDGSCSCPQGAMHVPCKHLMKVIRLVTGADGEDIVFFLGTWAGTAKGGFQHLTELLSSSQADGAMSEASLLASMLEDAEEEFADELEDVVECEEAASQQQEEAAAQQQQVEAAEQQQQEEAATK